MQLSGKKLSGVKRIRIEDDLLMFSMYNMIKKKFFDALNVECFGFDNNDRIKYD